MKKMLSLVVLCAAGSLTTTMASASLVITEVQQQTSSGTASTINGDWWELTNTGSIAVNLDGYQWADTEDQLGGGTPQTNFFPSISIGAGESIIILEEAAANEAAWRANWNASASLAIMGTDEMLPSPGASDTYSGLGSGGDAVYFYSPTGDLLSSYVYGTGTRGVSFEASTNGTDLGLSVIGENGAYKAANNDIGSPGTAVPEPATVSLLAIGGLLGLRRRHHA